MACSKVHYIRTEKRLADENVDRQPLEDAVGQHSPRRDHQSPQPTQKRKRRFLVNELLRLRHDKGEKVIFLKGIFFFCVLPAERQQEQ